MGKKVLGARTSTYLLEKPRICEHLPKERNYHVFYMLCRAAQSAESVHQVGHELSHWTRYKLLNQEGTMGEFLTDEQKKAWDDDKEFAAMHAALATLGFGVDHRGLDMRQALYKMFKIVLELGNLEFVTYSQLDEDAKAVMRDAGAVWLPAETASGEELAIKNFAKAQEVAGLLQVEMSQLVEALVTVDTMFAKGEVLKKAIRANRAYTSICSLCMHIYLLAFDWCVIEINRVISKPGGVDRCVGVLIYVCAQLSNSASLHRRMHSEQNTLSLLPLRRPRMRCRPSECALKPSAFALCGFFHPSWF